MVRGTRVSLIENSLKTGVLTGYNPNTREWSVKWDKDGGTTSTDGRNLTIIGYDPTKGSQKGIMHIKDRKPNYFERRMKMYA